MTSVPSSAGPDGANIGDWPRRLLHVPSMTSYLWQPGNIYGGITSPTYNIITYTWGRWMLRHPEDKPHVKAIDIKGIEWDVPRIDPEHFLTEEFLAVIQRSTGPTPPYAGRSEAPTQNQMRQRWHAQDVISDDEEPVRLGRQREELQRLRPRHLKHLERNEFLWLDVACIDQRPGSADSAIEIGRQGGIFRGAQHVFIWLTTFSDHELGSLLSNTSLIYEYGRILQYLPGCEPLRLELIQTSLEKLCDDPWFSSLWTLQEAYLRPDAMFLTRNGRLADDLRLRGAEEWHEFSFSLGILAMNMRSLYIHLYRQAHTESGLKLKKRYLDSIRQMGVVHLDRTGPLTPYVASQARTTTREEDRVYGIQQIFGFRLGASARSGAPLDYSRAELEVELGKAFLAKYPISSNLFIATRPVEFGDGWRIPPSSRIIESAPKSEWPVSN